MTTAAADLTITTTARLSAAWSDLCGQDPASGSVPPPFAEEIVAAVRAALDRPRPAGIALDPELERLAGPVAHGVGAVDVALAQLAYLYITFDRLLIPTLPRPRRAWASSQLNTYVQRFMIAVAREGEAELQVEARTDPLTGLGNRRALARRLLQERARAKRYHGTFSVGVMDLDGLKRINDADGHAAGDEQLIVLAKAIDALCRRSDAAYRLGGDEFAVLLPETRAAQAMTLMKRLARGDTPSFSFGIASFPDDDGDLLDVADQRLYEGRRLRRLARVP
jgi:diguanylate cyclase (GGDEF)-like protein